MCKIYNTIGSLRALKLHLENNNIHGFKSLKEVMDFQSSFTTSRQQLISDYAKLLQQEKHILQNDLEQLHKKIESEKQHTAERLTDELSYLKQQLNFLMSNTPKNIIQKLTKTINKWKYKKKIKQREQNFDSEVGFSINHLLETYDTKNDRYQFIMAYPDEALRISSQYALSELDRKKASIDKANPILHGALGEQRVVKTLESLSDDYHLINDFTLSFAPAIYNRRENDYIKSIQADHILVGPSGVFLIETKNWSERSLESLSLRSPVEQVKRTSFALFKLLNSDMSNGYLQLRKHHWGDRKVSIKNIIALPNTKPKVEFQHVKLLTVNELLGYINYFNRLFTSIETKQIAEFLLRINNQTTSLRH